MELDRFKSKDTIPDSLVITEVVLLFQYLLFKREDQASKFFFDDI